MTAVKKNKPMERCWWCGDDALYVAYHDREWGFPVADDRRLFEKVCLEGFQAGLSWLTILRKREAFREAFANFDYERVARFKSRDVERLVGNAGIVRHRGKIESTINNAQRAREMTGEFGSLAAYFWQWEPARNARSNTNDEVHDINIHTHLHHRPPPGIRLPCAGSVTPRSVVVISYARGQRPA